MTLLEAIKILETFNEWRRGSEMTQQNPKLIGEAIDIAINLMKGIAK